MSTLDETRVAEIRRLQAELDLERNLPASLLDVDLICDQRDKAREERDRLRAMINPDALIAACVPGGDSCDPQAVADAIREYLDAVGRRGGSRMSDIPRTEDAIRALILPNYTEVVVDAEFAAGLECEISTLREALEVADETLALIEDVGHGALSENVTAARRVIIDALSPE
jgi:hypothetical protein